MEKTKKDATVQGIGSATETQKVDNVREIGKHLPAVQAKTLGLPQTIETVELLYKRIQHRNRLEYYIDHLTTFELKKEDEDLEPKSYYHGCALEIKDDNGKAFTLRHPGVIKEVIDFMKMRFGARLAEIEAAIVLPKVA